ncbi:MAG: transcriptional repressor LexA [Eubacterium sp.]|nr:transcriptional repressor LexA [Eubacterium sp.]
MARDTISEKQLEILAFLKQEILTKGFPPSVREICTAVGLKSTSSVHAHLARLEKFGYIRRDPEKSRTIEILDDDFQTLRRAALSPQTETPDHGMELVSVPVVGRVAAGMPLLAVETIESYFPLPVDMLPNNETFILRVRGESMINAGILDGDYVLVEKTSTARRGEMVVALIDDSATVKTFYPENGHYRLQPENDSMDPIITDQLEILGRVIGVMRFF